MAVLHISDISKAFGDQVILDEASLHIKPGMRLGLVGANGSGKTTLLRILAGEESLDAGEISRRRDLRLGFLPQEIEEISGRSVREEVLASFKGVLHQERRLQELGEAIGGCAAGGGDGKDVNELLREMAILQESFEAAGGYDLESRAETILRGMGFAETDFDRPIAELSGGWRMRVALARLLLERPDILLMDEPTNHLDLESLLWLEGFLLDWPGSLVLVSHDRYFLNRMVTHVVELEQGRLDLYAGDYDHYEKEKRQRYEALANAAKNQQREIDAAERFVRRFRAKNTKAKQVQQKIRQLERMDRIEAPLLDRPTIKFSFPQPGRTGRVTAELKGVRKIYGRNVVYGGLDLVIERGQKMALVGANGAGKSTLLKLLAGVIEPDRGTIEFGYRVRREYFAQHQLEVLDPEATVLATMEAAAVRFDRASAVRSFLGAFLFGEDDVLKKVGVLSGGEKARLALALMLVDPAALLLLDEPTNHLDMVSREVLTAALRQSEGSIVFISHDRHLINSIASEVAEVADGRVTRYPGDWEYYQWKKSRTGQTADAASAGQPDSNGGLKKEPEARKRPTAESARSTTSRPGIPASPGPAGPGGSSESQPRTAATGVENFSYRERKDIQRKHRQVEKRILELEAEQKRLGAVLSDPGNASEYEVLLQASRGAEEVRDELAKLYPEWERLADRVAALGL